MKRLLFAVVIFVIFTSAFIVTVSAQEYSGICGDNATWLFYDDGDMLEIYGSGKITDSSWDNIIQTQNIVGVYIDEGITDIGNNIFSDLPNLEWVTLPETLVSIGERAFYSCDSLTDIYFPMAIDYIGNSAFENCDSLCYAEFIDIVYIGERAFFGCDALEEVYFDSMAREMEMGSQAFMECRNLTHVYFEYESELLHISDYSFMACENLEYVQLPASLISIGYNAFSKCPNLYEVVYMGSNKEWKNVSIDNGNEYIHSAEIYFELYVPTISVSQESISLVVGESAQIDITVSDWYDGTFAIGENIYQGGDTVELEFERWDEENISYIIKAISPGTARVAFNLADGDTYEILDTCQIAVNITPADTTTGKCGENATWNYDEDTKTLTISGTGETDRFYAITDCWYGLDTFTITKVIVNNGITSLGEEMFADFSNLVSVELPDSLVHIGRFAFRYCDSLEIINIPKNVNSIAGYLSPSKIEVSKENPDYCSINGVLFDKNVKQLLSFPKNSEYKSYTVPEGVVIIGDAAFFDVSLENLVLSDTVELIKMYAFECSQFNELTIPQSVRFISTFAFEDTKFNNIFFYGDLPFCANFQDFSLEEYLEWKAEIEIRLEENIEEFLEQSDFKDAFSSYNGGENDITINVHYNPFTKYWDTLNIEEFAENSIILSTFDPVEKPYEAVINEIVENNEKHENNENIYDMEPLIYIGIGAGAVIVIMSVVIIIILVSRKKKSKKTNHNSNYNNSKTQRNNFCPVCGQKVEPDAEFCGVCGTKHDKWSRLQ